MKTILITLLALAWTLPASAQYAGIYGGTVDDTTYNDANAGVFAVFISMNGQATVVGYDVDSFQHDTGQAGGVAAQFNVPANGNWNFSSNNTIFGVLGSGSNGCAGSFSGTLSFTNGDTVSLVGNQQSLLGSFQNAAGYYSGTFSGIFGGKAVAGPLLGVLSADGQFTFSIFVNGALNDGGQGQFGSNNQLTTTNRTSGSVVSGTLTNATLTIGGSLSNSKGSATFTVGRSSCLSAAIGLTISPPAITNGSIGEVTLTITNLTACQTVNVEWYADLNTNGIIDAGDLLISSFQVTDGQVSMVAGLPNLNVPGDEDGLTNGQIRVVSYYPSVASSTAIGSSLIRVSDPSGNRNSVTQAFSINERFYPQGIAGRLTSAGTGLPLTNAVVGLQSLVGTSLTFKQSDTNGNYSFCCVPGQYEMLGLNGNGAVYNESPIVSVACGQTTTNNLIITNGTFIIAGRVTDAATGLGIPAMSVDAGTANGLAVLTFADTNGNYALQVTPNTWHVHPSSGAAAATGYVDPSRIAVPVTSASVSNVNFALTKATALIYGTVSDTANNPVLGIQLAAGNELGRSVGTNGSYCLGAQAGTWNPAPDSGGPGQPRVHC